MDKDQGKPNQAAGKDDTSVPPRDKTVTTETQPAEERGERMNTGKAIESGGTYDPDREGTSQGEL